MKKDSKKQFIRKKMKLFCMILIVVLCVGTLGMWIYASGLAGKRNNANGEEVQTVLVEDLFRTFQNMIATDDTVGELDDVEKDDRLFESALVAGENAIMLECAEEEKISILFAGDVLLDEHYAVMANLKDRGGNVEEAFSQELLEVMRNADAFMLNNEFTFTDRGTPTIGKKFTFRARPESVSLLQEIGVDIAALANNHMYDYGEISLLDTLATLENAGISYTGAGRNLEEAMKPVYLIANGMKIGIISATQIERNGTPDTKAATEVSPGVFRCMDTTNLVQVISEMEQNCDFTILYIHWGTESQEEIDWLQEEQAPVYAEAGVDLIIGDHPHCLQKIDTVLGVPVIYSMGNFWFNSKTQNSCVVEVVLKEKKLDSFRFMPCKQEDSRTRLLDGMDKQGVLNYMRGISPNVKIDEEGYVNFE